MSRAVLWDSSAILALVDRDDANHGRARNVLDGISSEKRPGFVTSFIEAEAHALLLRRLGRTIAREWLFGGGLSVTAVLPHEEHRAKEIIGRYQDKDFSLCDAISFAVMAARRVRAVFTFDHHFRQYGRFDVLGG
jgi:uncharacterized protein